MKLLTSVLCLFVVSASSIKTAPADPRNDGPRYEFPPFGSETTCFFFVPCYEFPSDPICALPKSGCGGAFTFENSCYLSFYNCEHPSNEYYEYCVGECYTKNIV